MRAFGHYLRRAVLVVVVSSLDEDDPAARRRRPLAGVGDKLTTSLF